MKKIFLFTPLFLFAFFLGCQSDASYRISGTVDKEAYADSTLVYLSEIGNIAWINIDSTYIKNGAFQFQGKVDSLRVCYVRLVPVAQKPVVTDIVLESGNISVTVDTNLVKISGTEQNNLLQKINEKSLELSTKARTLMTKQHSGESEEGDKKSNLEKIEQLQKEYFESMKDFALKNVNSVVGTHILLNNHYSMSLEDKEMLVSKMNEETKSSSRVKLLIESIEEERNTTVGKNFVDVVLKSIDGEEMKLSDFVGKTDYLLVDFWASWCSPCIASLPKLKSFYEKNKGERFDIVGISLDEKKESWKNAVQKHQLPWSQMSDLKGWKSIAAEKYAIKAIPSVLLIDKNGVIVGRNMSEEEIQKKIDN